MNGPKRSYSTSRFLITGDRPEVHYSISPAAPYNYVYLESVSIPIVYDVFPSITFIFVDGAAVSHTLSLEAGSEQIGNLLGDLVSEMDLAYPAGAPYNFDTNANFTWEIQSTAGDFSLTAVEPVLAQRLGLIGTVSSTAGLLTSQKYNLSPLAFLIETDLPIDGHAVSYTNLTPPAIDVTRNVHTGSTYTAVIAITSSIPAGLDTFTSGNINAGAIGTHHKIKSDGVLGISIKITDELGVLVNTYPQRWQIVLVMYNYYESLM